MLRMEKLQHLKQNSEKKVKRKYSKAVNFALLLFTERHGHQMTLFSIGNTNSQLYKTNY